MNTAHWKKAAIAALIIILAFTVSWEIYWRKQGFGINYNDDKDLWAYNRQQVDDIRDNSTVFIGSSRIKFDLDIPTWEKLTGSEAIQLAIGGSSPLPVLDNLAADERFKGRLVIDVTEGLFFNEPGSRAETWAAESVERYKDQTPSQKASAAIGRALESRLVFLEEAMFAIKPLTEDLRLKNRAGMFTEPVFPKNFETNDIARQSRIPEVFMNDTSIQREVKNIWITFGMTDTTFRMGMDTVQKVIARVKKATDKIKARGGQIIFVRTPSSGDVWVAENKVFKRADYWEKLLTSTGIPGVHFEDYPSISKFECPEWSHLSLNDAIVFTRSFVSILEKYGWNYSTARL